MTALSRPNLIARGVTLVALAGVVVAIVLLVIGGKTYDLNLSLANASGVRPGSQVLLGGVPVGTVNSLDLNRRNVVVAHLHLDPSKVHVGQGASASIVAANLLGEKYVALQPGNGNQPLPANSTLPESATTIPTDLDQIVDVLDDPTRARLAILLNEAGIAVAGRRADVGAILRQFPLSLTAATRLLTQLVQDNHTLSDLVSNSNGFITRINAQSGDLKQVIGAAAGAVTTLSRRQAQLTEVAANVYKPVHSLVTFFEKLTNTANDLTPVLGQITTAAPWIHRVLVDVKPFTNAAVPTLNRAAAVAPTLTRLAAQATPTVKLAVPTLSSLENIARLAQPLSAWLGLSSQDLFNIFAGWTRAIQFRDGLSHVFNGDLYFDPKVLLDIANIGASPAQKQQNLLDVLNPALLRTMGLLSAATTAQTAAAKPASQPTAVPSKIPARRGITRRPTAPPSATSTPRPTNSSGAAAQNSGSGGGSGGGAGSGSSGSSLSNLLSYLLGQ